MIWMGNDLSLINDWESYLKGIHFQHGMGSLLRWTSALEWTHVLPAASACPDASLRARVWDVAGVPESIPLSPLLPPGNEMCSDVDSSPPPISFCCSLSLLSFSITLPSPPFSLFFIWRHWVFSPLPSWADGWLPHSSGVLSVWIWTKELRRCQICGCIFFSLLILIIVNVTLSIMFHKAMLSLYMHQFMQYFIHTILDILVVFHVD